MAASRPSHKTKLKIKQEITMGPKTDVKKRPVTTAKKNSGLSAEEITAMKETIKERKMAANKEEMEKAVFEKIAAMKDNERVMAKKDS